MRDGVSSPCSPRDPPPPLGLGRALTGGSLNAPGPGGGNMFEKPVSPAVFRGGSDFRRLLKDVEQRYSDAFAEVGPGTLQDFKNLIDCVDGFFDLLADPETDFRVKLMDYAKIREDVFEFCGYYARWLGRPLMERLKHEICEILEEAVDWWEKQDIFDEPWR